MAVDKQALLLIFSKVGYVPSVTDWQNLIDIIPDGTDEDIASNVASLLVQNPSFASQLQPKTADNLNNPNSNTLPTTLAVANRILDIINDYNAKIATVSEQASTAIEDEAVPATVPVDTTNKFVKYSISTAGTYANFPDASSTAIEITSDDLNEGVVELWGKNGVWSKNIIPMPMASIQQKSTLGPDVEALGFAKNSVVQPLQLKTDAAITTKQNETTIVDSVAKSSASYKYTTSTFSGWCSPIGSPQNFNEIKFNVRARTANITNIRVYISSLTKTGTSLATATLAVNIAAGANEDVVWNIGDTIANETDDLLIFGFACDQLCDVFAIDTGIVYPTPLAAYITGANQPDSLSSFFNSTNTINIWVQTSLIDQLYVPTVDFANEIVNQSDLLLPVIASQPGLLNSKQLTDESIEKVFNAAGNSVASIPLSSAAYRNTVSTFSGWCSPIGSPQNFNAIRFKVRARTAAITSIRCYLANTNKAGASIEIDTLNVNISPNQEQTIVWVLDNTIANGDADMLIFGFACDQLCDMFGSASGSSQTYTTPLAAYKTNGVMPPDLTSFSDVSSLPNNTNLYVETFYGEYGTAPTDSFVEEIGKKLNINTSNDPIADIILPSQLYAVPGTETNFYFKNFITSNIPISLLNINVDCSKGAQYEEFYRVTPLSTDNGAFSFVINVYFGNILLASKTGTLNIAASSAGSGNAIKALLVGDSLLSDGQIPSDVLAAHGSDVMPTIFVGTLGTGAAKHEGRGGWTIDMYSGPGTTYYRFNISSVGAVGYGSKYSDGVSVYQVVEVNISSGTGYINTTLASGNGTPATSGSLTFVSGNGDSELTYTSTSKGPGNPFWNSTTNKLDFANYLSSNSIAVPDWVIFHLGINDIFGYTNDTDALARIATMISGYNSLIANVQAAVPGIKIGLCITTPPCATQDGFGANYGTGQTQKRYFQNLVLWQKALIAAFDTAAQRIAGVYLVPYSLGLDRTYGMQTSNWKANAYSSVQILTILNGVHPGTIGYKQLADILWAFLKNNN